MKCGSPGQHIWNNGNCTFCGIEEAKLFEQIVVADGDVAARKEAVKNLGLDALERIASGHKYISEGERRFVDGLFGGYYKTDREEIRKAAIDAINVASALNRISNATGSESNGISTHASNRKNVLQEQCKSSGHKWDGCICPTCGEKRDEAHNWLGCACDKCGKTRDKHDESHEWQGCKCSKCGTTRDEAHDFVCCKCSRCGKEIHKWTHGKCSACGIIRRHYCKFTDLHLAIHPTANLNDIRDLCLSGLVNVGDEEDWTPLMKASGKDGNLAIVKLLIELGANINARSNRDTTAASMAALHGKQDVLDFLITKGVVIDFIVRRL